MAAMHYCGNFSAERGQLKEINETITKELLEMEKNIDNLNSCWKDEKSVVFISSSKELVNQIKRKQDSAIQDGNNILTQVEQALEIYQ